MLPDPYGSDVDYHAHMGRPWFEDDDADVWWQWQQDEAEHEFWCSTEPPAEDLLEVIERAA